MLLNATAGLLHYIFNLLAARGLHPEEFGVFSVWFAWVSIGLSIGAVAQYGANFFPVGREGLKRSLAVSVVMAVLVFLLLFGGYGISPEAIAVTAVLIAPFCNWLMGQVQRRLLLMTFAVGALVVAFAKVGFSILGYFEGDPQFFYWAVPASFAVGVFFLLPFLQRQVKRALPAQPSRMSPRLRQKIMGAVILSFSSVFIPNIDLIYVDFTQNTDAVTKFAQVSLFYKVVFFVILILAQWLLPHQLNRAEDAVLKPRRMKHFVRVCVMGLVFSLGASAIADTFYRIILDKEFTAPMLWVFLSSFNVSLLTGLFLEVQDQISKYKLMDAFACLVIQVLASVIMIFLKLNLETYLQVQVALNSMLLFLLLLGAGGILTGKVVDQRGDRSAAT